ncbi:MAG: translocation/assembly module TamB domain-containing protein [Vicinamibacterales bacterium]
MNTGVPEPQESAVAQTRARSKRRLFWRWARRALALVVALVAAALVSLFTVDLGRLFPQLRGLAERRGTTYLNRPLHIGRVSALLTPGRFAVDDVVIEGRAPGDRPFFKARRVFVHVPWWTMFRRQIFIELEVSDFDMVVETWAGGIHNVPRLTGPPSTGTRKSPFNTTTRFAYARGGNFTYEDHATPWRVFAPNLSFELVRAETVKSYVGKAQFSGGAIQIQSYLPMAASMSTRFVLDGPTAKIQHLDLTTDGSLSHVTGVAEFGKNWPRQTYNVSSTIDFPRMKQIFFAKEGWSLAGTGQFAGQFKLFKEGGRELAGQFSSETAQVNELVFPHLHGDLIWTGDRFAVTHADSDLLGGHTRFSYAIAPLGTPEGATARFSAEYVDTDLFDVNRIVSLRGLRLAGSASGSLSLEWHNGQFGPTHRGNGHTRIVQPPGVVLAPTSLPAVPLPQAPEPRPFESKRRAGPLALGADLHYAIDPSGVTFDDSWAATSLTYVAFNGRMAKTGESQFPFDVTSHDWQESDRLLASIMSAVSGPTGAVEVAGRGTFHGVMTGNFSAPVITGQFASEATHVWGVTWGRALAQVVIHGGYVDISNSRIGDRPEAFIQADGRFALGFRKDGAEEINAHVQLTNWPIVDLRHAFQLDDWPMDGTLASCVLDLNGRYREMFGGGQLRIENGSAWKEQFDWATAELALEGTGMRISRIDMRKGPGVMHGAARIGWNGTYAFDADGQGIPVETLDNFKFPNAPLSGGLQFKASGSGEFDSPTYAFEGSVRDLFVGDEGIGPVTGRISVSKNVMTIERLFVLSSRLNLEGTGTIALDEHSTANLRMRFQGTSIDPYLKFVMSDGISPYTRAVIGGTLLIRGPLSQPNALSAEMLIDDASLTLFDYELKNDGPLRLVFDGGRLQIASFKLKGGDTNLSLSGGLDTIARTVNLTAAGDASLSMLQLLRNFQGLIASGAARLNASVTGSFDHPSLSGSAQITDARLRPLASPHSLEQVNGTITFGANPATRANEVTLTNMKGRIGNGDVVFGGTIALEGYRLAEYNLTAQGRSMRLRYPAGFSSTVDMRLNLTGTAQAPSLTGTIDVLRTSFLGVADPGAGLFGLAAGAAGGGSPLAALPTAIAESGTPLALAINVTAPRMFFIDNKTLGIEGTADLHIGGTFARPVLTGGLEVLGGHALLYGNRYAVREGRIDFKGDDPPEFDITADTHPRVPGQTFTVNVGVSGRFDAFKLNLSSDPPLAESEVLTLLFGGTPDFHSTEQRSLRSSQELQQRMIQTAGAVLLASPLTSRVGSVFERTGAVDTVMITPLLTNETAFQQLNPSARVTLGKRISPKVFLTYSRTLSGRQQEEVILLEYDESDRLSWVLSRNENGSFALDFRVRYAF